MPQVSQCTIKELRATRDCDLPELALDALRDRQPLLAFAAADRWLRMAGPNVSNLLLHAEASHRLGLRDFALADLAMALERDAFHRRVNRRLADWGDGEQAVAAAQTLIGFSGRDAEHGLRVLQKHGAKGAGLLRFDGRMVEGWLAWSPQSRAELCLTGADSWTLPLGPQANCRWGEIFGAAATVRYELRSATIFRAALLIDGEQVAAARCATPVLDDVPAEAVSWPDVTIVVPVYDDFDATRDCLAAAAVATETVANSQILIVDDASPNPRIKAFVADFAARFGRRLLVNRINLGFVGAVNRALRQIPVGDVLLLNADALLPPGSLERFLQIARSQTSVGVINPLSNHGEFVSYPKPFRRNDFERDLWRTTDDAAASAGDVAIDIPSGTGFCMYVTRACLDAVGDLSEQFAEGYLEDADFGLRARRAGFRNVCAPSIYVPHLGSRSFKGAKAALVARNRLTLARRFPTYEAECDAFVRADPLRQARARLEFALADQAPRRRLIIGMSRFEPALRARAEDLAREGVGALLGLVEQDAHGFSIRLAAFDGKAPQNVVLSEAVGAENLFGALMRWPFDRVECVATLDLPSMLRDRLRDFLEPVDLIIAADIGVGGRTSPSLAAPRDEIDGSATAWKHAMARAERVIGIDALSRAFCDWLAGKRPAAPNLPVNPAKPIIPGALPMLAIVYPYQTAQSLGLLQSLSAQARKLDMTMVLLGSTGFDEKLISEGVFVTGPTRQEERLRLIEIYGADRLLLPYRQEGFWSLEMLLEARPGPAAYFDWSGAGFRRQKGDLALDASCSDEEAARMIVAWLHSRQEGECAREVA